MKLQTIVICLLIGIVAAMTVENKQQNYDLKETQAALVYATCEYSRVSPNISEKTCADMQNHFNVEYLCTKNNNLPTNQCWTEAK